MDIPQRLPRSLYCLADLAVVQVKVHGVRRVSVDDDAVVPVHIPVRQDMDSAPR